MKIRHMIQRIKRGYSDEDVWALDEYFLEVFIPALKQLKETKHGVPREFTIGEDGNSIDIDIADKSWKQEVDKMISHFESIDLYGDRPETTMESNRYHIQEGFKLFAKNFENLWD